MTEATSPVDQPAPGPPEVKPSKQIWRSRPFIAAASGTVLLLLIVLIVRLTSGPGTITITGTLSYYNSTPAPCAQNPTLYVRQDAPRSRTAMLAAEFQRRHRLLPAGPEALAAVLDEPIAKWRALDGRGATVRVSMEAMFRRLGAALRAQAVEVWHVPRGHELLISDTPAFTFRYLGENAAIQLRVAIGDCHGIALPLARDCLAVIGPAAKDDDLTPDQVRLFNQVQVGITHRHVYYRPGSGLGAFVRAMQ